MERDILAESGRVKVLEKTFLSKSFLEKIIQAANFSGYLGELEKTYCQPPKHFATASEIVDFFEKERIRLWLESEKTLPEFLSLFVKVHQDFHNIKILVREDFQIKNQALYRFSGLSDPFSLREALETGNLSSLNRILRPAVQALYAAQRENPPACFLILNRHFHLIRRRLLRQDNNSFLLAYHRQETDWENLSYFLLWKSEKEKVPASEFLKGGKIAPEKYTSEELLWKTWADFYPKVVVPVTEETFDREYENNLLDFLRPSRSIPYGVEVVFSYYLARDKELARLKKLTLGKFYNLAPEILKSWLGPTYV